MTYPQLFRIEQIQFFSLGKCLEMNIFLLSFDELKEDGR